MKSVGQPFRSHNQASTPPSWSLSPNLSPSAAKKALGVALFLVSPHQALSIPSDLSRILCCSLLRPSTRPLFVLFPLLPRWIPLELPLLPLFSRLRFPHHPHIWIPSFISDFPQLFPSDSAASVDSTFVDNMDRAQGSARAVMRVMGFKFSGPNEFRGIHNSRS
ncbi:hypothetical protein AMTRI_Chr06g172540 [Amborella trichopoda]